MKEDKTCRYCGRKLSQFYETSMLGCEKCYKEFAAEIIPILRNMQGKTSHAGKTPRVTGIERELLFEYRRLLLSREEAMLAGRFKEARELDAEIRTLTAELSDRGLK